MTVKRDLKYLFIFMKKRNLWFLLTFVVMAFSTDGTKPYPQDYFRSPVNHAMLLSGTFGELRPNHFHAGIDIKPAPGKGVGENLYAVADGYVSRIKVSSRGYGNALYIDHPNGYTSVYAHLQKYSPEVAAFIKQKQYEQETFEIELFPTPDQFVFNSGDVIGTLGISGSSFGPHLHFELRDTKTEKTINPLLFGYKVKDARKPFMEELKIYHLDGQFNEVKEQIYKTRRGGTNYYISKDTLDIKNDYLGLGLKVYDAMDGVSNWNGIYRLEMFQDGAKVYDIEMETFSFDETRYLNAHCDHGAYLKNKSRFNRCFILPGNKLSMYKEVLNQGLIYLAPGKTTSIQLVASDYAGNQSKLNILARRSKETITPKEKRFNYFLPHSDPSYIFGDGMELSFPANSFYEDQYIFYEVTPENSFGFYSDVHQFGNKKTPVHQAFEIALRPKNLPDRLRSKAVIALCEDEKVFSSLGGTWENGLLKTKSKTMGDFTIVVDTIPPIIKPIYIKPFMNKGYRMLFRITDAFSGLGTYKATVDGQWILMEFDKKKNQLSHRFDGQFPKGKHQLVLEVSDAVGNTKTYNYSFSN